MKYSKDLYYPCYSPRVLEHLMANGFKPEASFRNFKTLKVCHVFKKDKDVCECIAEVSNVNKAETDSSLIN